MMLKELQKAVVRAKITKSVIADHIWKGKGGHQPLWNEVKMIDREPHCKIKESVH